MAREYHPEAIRKQKKAAAAKEAKRQASTEGAGGGRAQGKLVKKNPPKGGGQRGSEDEQKGSTPSYSRRGGQEMPTASYGRNPSAKKKGSPSSGTRGTVDKDEEKKDKPMPSRPTTLPRAKMQSKTGRRRQPVDRSAEGLRSTPTGGPHRLPPKGQSQSRRHPRAR